MKHLGIDVHLKSTEVCELSEKGKVVRRARIATTEAGLRTFFGRRKRSRIVMECTNSTPWVYRLLRDLGHEVLVLDPRKIRLIAESTLKCDKVDAEILARLSRFEPEMLQPVYQRSYAAQELRTRLKVRQSLVRSRAKLVTTIRGSLRAHGYRLGSCATRSFVARWANLEVEEGLRQALDPLVETIAQLTDRITSLERELYAEAKDDELPVRLQEVPGVGPLDAQWGSIHVLDSTGSELWSVADSEHGVTGLAAGDADQDGQREVYWGAGYTADGPDYLFAADSVTHQQEWQSVDLVGPFAGLDVGDVDADGSNELLVTTLSSDSGQGDGLYPLSSMRRVESWSSSAHHPLATTGRGFGRASFSTPMATANWKSASRRVLSSQAGSPASTV